MRVLAIASVALLCACTGAASTEFFDDANGTSDDDVTQAPNATLPAPSDTAPSGQAGDPTSGSSDTPTQPTNPTDPPVTPIDPPPVETCQIEVEPNNAQSEATAFDTCLAGTIGSRQDTDFGAFTVPANAKTIAWKTDGGSVTVRVTNGRLVDYFPISNGGTVTPGQKLFAEVSANSGKPAYAVHFTYQ